MNFEELIAVVLQYASIGMLILGALVFCTNVIVEVIKGLFPKVPTNFVVVAVALVVTVLALVIAAAIMDITIMWYYAVGAVVLSFFVANAAMNGFDKFKEAVDKLKEYRKI